ncbi:MAG: hypothetical protein WCV86_05440 [Patescibacteria group bacterium]
MNYKSLVLEIVSENEHIESGLLPEAFWAIGSSPLHRYTNNAFWAQKLTFRRIYVISMAIAEMFQLLLLDASGKPKARVTARLQKDRVMGEEKLLNIRYLRPTALIQTVSKTDGVPQVLIVRFEFWKESQRIRTDHVIQPAGRRVSVSPSGDFDLEPFKRLGRVKGTWKTQILVAEFPAAIMEKMASKSAVLNNLTYTTVLNAGLQWEILGGSSIEGLDRTGQYRDRNTAEAVLNSSQNYGLDEI